MSVSWVIADGASISYWFDSWTYLTKASQTTPDNTTRKYSLQMANHIGISQVILAGTVKWEFRFIWKLKIPPTVRVFGYLLLHGRLLTHDVMINRGLSCDTQCEVCHQCPLETAKHLFFQCGHARQVWRLLSSMLGFNLLQTGDTVQAIVSNSGRACQRRIPRSQWGTLFFAVCWFIWRNRNRKKFDGIESDPHWIAHQSIKESKLWRKFC
ncbi:uncharacterized protein LOC144572798 [Carex rostrata]